MEHTIELRPEVFGSVSISAREAQPVAETVSGDDSLGVGPIITGLG
jgi:hypothetical protein